MKKQERIQRLQTADELISTFEKLENFVSTIKLADKGRLYTNDPEYKTLSYMIRKIEKLNTKSLLSIDDNQIRKLIYDIYPMYLNLKQFLANPKSYLQYTNHFNGAGSFYKISGIQVSKQIAPMEYKPVFSIQNNDNLPKVFQFGEDIMAAYTGYRDIITKIDIFSEVAPNKFEQIKRVNLHPAFDWCYDIDSTLFILVSYMYMEKKYKYNIVGKTKDGYKEIKFNCENESEKTPEINSQIEKLKQDSEKYLTEKYLHRSK